MHVYINLGDDCLLLKGARKKKRAEKANIMEIVITNLLQIINPKVRAGSFNKLHRVLNFFETKDRNNFLMEHGYATESSSIALLKLQLVEWQLLSVVLRINP